MVVPVALGVFIVALVRTLVTEAAVTNITGTTPVVNETGKVIANDPVTVTIPVIILYGIPSMTLVLSCAAVRVLPAVNVNLPDIS
jgi:hypothetical protein